MLQCLKIVVCSGAFLSFLQFDRVEMGLLETELAELKQCVPRVIPDSTVEACVPAMVRVKIE